MYLIKITQKSKTKNTTLQIRKIIFRKIINFDHFGSLVYRYIKLQNWFPRKRSFERRKDFTLFPFLFYSKVTLRNLPSSQLDSKPRYTLAQRISRRERERDRETRQSVVSTTCDVETFRVAVNPDFRKITARGTGTRPLRLAGRAFLRFQTRNTRGRDPGGRRVNLSSW